jgi:signal transduction histidine kinase/CHASE3 domain sensor protein
MKRLQLRLLFLVIVVVLLVVSLVTYRNLNNYMEEVRLIRHSNSVIKAVQSVLSTIKDAEIGYRGFQLTRDTIYLDPFYSAVKLLPGQLNELDSLISGNQLQQARVDSLMHLLENQFLIINSILSNVKSSALLMDRYETNLLARSRKNLNAIRGVIKAITDSERNVFDERVDNEKDYKAIAPLALLFYTVLSLLGITFLFTRILWALKSREEAEQQLRINLIELELQKSLINERKIILNEAESLSNMGSWKWSEKNDDLVWSEGLYNIFGLQADKKISWGTFLDNVFHEDQLLVGDFLNEVKTKKSGGAIDYRLLKNGQLRYLSLTVKPHALLNIDILGAVVDITERKDSERKLEQFNAELKRSNEDLEQFAYVASHDLQEPLRKIRAFGDRLSVKYSDLLDEKGKDYVARMQIAAARMQTLIEDLLSFSRVSRVEVDYQWLDMNTVLKEVIEDLDAQINREGAIVHIGKMPALHGDKGQLKRLFQNLISNAIKFHHPGKVPIVDVHGKVMKELEVLDELGISLPKADYIRISIKDNGIGFKADYVDKIFNIFQRLHGRAAYEGTGIGLAICRKIVTNHKGYITAKSIENIGSEFIVIFSTDLKNAL